MRSSREAHSPDRDLVVRGGPRPVEGHDPAGPAANRFSAPPAFAPAGLAGRGGGPMRMAAVRQLQRTHGNAAVQRYVKVAAAANWGGVGADMRVSDDGNMAVKDSDIYPEGQGRALQLLYATPGVIAQAKGVLQANGSLYEIHQGAPPPAQALAPDNTPRQLHEVEVENKMLDVRGANVGTALNCNENTGQVMGANDLTQQFACQIQLGGKLKQKKHNIVDEHDLTGFMNPSKQRAQSMMTGKKDATKAATAYDKMKPKKKTKEAQKTGVNQYADAHAGEGYGIWDKGGSHFAPVLAESGGDRVTLEAHFQSQAQNFHGLAPGSATFNNPEWYFRMYGPLKTDHKGKVIEDQTFYGEYEKAANTGGKSDSTVFVLAFQKINQPLSAQDAVAAKVGLGKSMARDLVAAANWLSNTPQTQGKQGVDAAANLLRKNENAVPANGNGVDTLLAQWVGEIDTALQAIDAQAIPDNMARGIVIKKFESQMRRLRRAVVHVQHMDTRTV